MSSETELGSDVIVRRVTPVKRYCRATPVFVGMIINDQVILHVRCESLSHRWTSTFPGRMDVSTPGAFHYFRTLAEPTVGGISLNADNFLVRELPSLEAEYPGGRRAKHRAGGSGECDSGSDDSPCGNQILPEFEHSDHLGSQTSYFLGMAGR